MYLFLSRHSRDGLRERYSGGGRHLPSNQGLHDGRPSRVLLRQESQEEGAQEREAAIQGHPHA